MIKLYNGDVEINEIGVYGINVYVKVLKDGKTNYDLLLEDDTKGELEKIDAVESTSDVVTDASPEDEMTFTMELNHYFIHDFNLIYDDQSSDMYVELINLNHDGRGDFSQSEFILETITKIDEINFKMEDQELLKKSGA